MNLDFLLCGFSSSLGLWVFVLLLGAAFRLAVKLSR